LTRSNKVQTTLQRPGVENNVNRYTVPATVILIPTLLSGRTDSRDLEGRNTLLFTVILIILGN